ncbi:MAG TPA: alkaline phosphatase family protein, partial [Vicinamibacteria bacterium]|nr:alkaline phosphatase family protein [Vicinamibacteria bacterium]
MKRLLPLVLLVHCAPGRAWGEGQTSNDERRRGPRLVLVSLDGASAPVIDAAVRRGVMPNLARLRAEGAVSVSGALTSLPVKTAAGHATLFTGAWCDRNGIAGNEVPVPRASVLTSVSGFTSEMLRAEPLWVTAARQGLDVTVVSATQAWPSAPFLAERRFGGDYGPHLSLLDGYQSRRTPSVALTAKDVRLEPAAGWRGTLPAHRGPMKDFGFTVSGARVEVLLYDDPADPVEGFDTAYLATSKAAGNGVVLKPVRPAASAAAFRGLTLHTEDGPLGLHFRLFSLSPDGADLLLYASDGSIVRSNRPQLASAAVEATGGFVGNGADDLYKDGALGPPVWKGGDGTAEARYLETAFLVERQFRRLMDFGLDATKWDVLIGYLP